MTEANDPEITAQERQLTDATRAVDVDALDRMYADDVIFTGVTGAVCDKAAVLDEARRGREAREKSATLGTASVVDYQKDELRIVRHGDAAVSSFRFGVTVRADGKDVIRRYRTTNVWTKTRGAWQVVAAHTAALG